MNRQRLQKLAGLLKEEISRDEAVTDRGAVQTIVDGKRGVGFITKGGNSSQNWETIQNMIQDNGLKSMHVKGNEFDAYIIYAQGYANDATELKNIAEKYGGYLHADATAADTRRIGKLLGYKKDEIDAYIKKWYPRYIDEIVVLPTDSSKQLKQDLVDAMYDDVWNFSDGDFDDWFENAFDNGDSAEVEEAYFALEEVMPDKAEEFYYDEAPYLVEKMFKDESELEEITVKPTPSMFDDYDEYKEFIGDLVENTETTSDYDYDFEEEFYKRLNLVNPNYLYIIVLKFLVDLEFNDPIDLFDYIEDSLMSNMSISDAVQHYLGWDEEDAEDVEDVYLDDVADHIQDNIFDDEDYFEEYGMPFVRRALKRNNKLDLLKKITNNLKEITVKPSGDITWESYEKACKSYISNTFDLSQECNFTQLGSTGEEEWQTTVLGSVGVESFIQLCKENYEEVDHLIHNAAFTRSINNLKDLVKATVFIHESKNTVNLEVVFSFAVILRFQEASTLGEIVVMPTQKPSGVFIDGKEVDVSSIEIDGVDPDDAPDYSDAYAVSAQFEDGTELDDNQIETLNDDYYDVIYDRIWDMLNEIVVKPSRSPKYKVGDVIKIKGIHQQNSFEITGVYDNGNDCYTHASITMYLIGYNTIQKGTTDVDTRIPLKLINQYWYSVIPAVYTQSTLGVFTIPEEYVETKAQVDEIVVKSSKKDENYWEWEKDLPKDLNIDWDWADCEYDDDVDEDGNPVFFGTVRGTDQYRDMYEADWGGPYEEASENKLYRIKRIGNLEDLDEIVVKPTVIPTFWRYEKDLPESIKITWDYNTTTIEGRERDSQHAEGSIIGQDENGSRYHGTWMGWVKYDDYDEIDSISYIQNISKLRNKSFKEITVKPTSQPVRYGNLYSLKPDDLPQQDMTWQEAHEYLKKLGPDWRLPTLVEIVYISKQKGLTQKFEYYWTVDPYNKTRNKSIHSRAVPLLGGEFPDLDINVPARKHMMSFGYAGDGDKYKVCPVKTVKPNKLAEILGLDEITVKPTSQPIRYGNLYTLRPENIPQEQMSESAANAYLAKLGPSWRLPTFDELYDIYEKNGLEFLFDWFGTSSLYEFDDGTRAGLLAAYLIGGNPEYNSKADIAKVKSAWWKGSRYRIFPVRNVTTREEEPSKLAEILGINKNINGLS